MQRQILSTFVISLTVLTFSSAFGDDPIIDTGATRLLEIDAGIYAVEPNFAGANGALILSSSGNIVVDTHGTPASAAALIEAVAQVSNAPIRYVINTHWHVDHHTGNTAYKNAFGNDVIFISHDITRRDIPTLGAAQYEQVAQYRSMPIQAAEKVLADSKNAHGEPLNEQQAASVEQFRDSQVEFSESTEYDYVLADLTYSKSVTLHGEPHAVEVFFLHPAHTESDSIVYIREQKVLIAGDLLTQPILWSWSSYPSSYVKTLRALEALPIEKIVIGHGGPVLDGTSYLTQVREFLEAAVEHARDAHAEGLGDEAAIETAATNAAIENFRRKFVPADQDGMFDQMVGWTISRAYTEF